MTETTGTRQRRIRNFSFHKVKISILAAACMALGASGYLLGETRHTQWHDMFKYDGNIKDVYGVKRPALSPLRSVWLLVDQESGDPELTKGNFMDCQARARDRMVRDERSAEQENPEYSVTELLLDCKGNDGGARVFVVRGLAGIN